MNQKKNLLVIGLSCESLKTAIMTLSLDSYVFRSEEQVTASRSYDTQNGASNAR